MQSMLCCGERWFHLRDLWNVCSSKYCTDVNTTPLTWELCEYLRILGFVAIKVATLHFIATDSSCTKKWEDGAFATVRNDQPVLPKLDIVFQCDSPTPLGTYLSNGDGPWMLVYHGLHYLLYKLMKRFKHSRFTSFTIHTTSILAKYETQVKYKHLPKLS